MRRTTATTEYLKECMGTALLELMQEKPIEKITIEEMTAKADVGRSTYFRHFKDKNEVLIFKLITLWDKFARKNNLTKKKTPPTRIEIVTLFFQFCFSTREINSQILEAGLENVILEAYLILMKPVNEANISEYYSSNFVAYGFYGIVVAWIRRDYLETPEEMTKIFFEFLKN